MLLNEIKVDKKGTYAGVRFSEGTKRAIEGYIKDNKIPNGIVPSKMHTTLLYSRKHLPDYNPTGKYDKPLIGTPTTFDVWKSSNEDGNDTSCLVLEYDCPELVKRHKFLMDEHEATYDYPKYKTHITLSYDIGDMNIKDLPKFTDDIEIESEYKEDLDLSWSQNNK